VKRITGLDWPLLAPAGCPAGPFRAGGRKLELRTSTTPRRKDSPIYAPCILILIAEFCITLRRRKAEEAHADAVIA